MKTRRHVKLLAVILLFGAISFLNHVSIAQEGKEADKYLEALMKEFKPVEPLLPPDVKIKPGFEPGEGPVVGDVQMIQGEAFVVHKGQKDAYRLAKDHPLFNGDVLVTSEKSRLNVRMLDKSVFSMAPYTKLMVDKSSYVSEKDERSTSLGLLFGRARFIASKITGSPNYEIKTPTAVCGVRGSDFALAVVPGEEISSSLVRLLASLSISRSAFAAPVPALLTVVVTGPETTVGFAGLVGPVQVVGPTSLCTAAAGAAATSPLVIGAAAAGAALNAVGPGLAAMSMPPGYR
jgi:hypothetical protein